MTDISIGATNGPATPLYVQTDDMIGIEVPAAGPPSPAPVGDVFELGGVAAPTDIEPLADFASASADDAIAADATTDAEPEGLVDFLLDELDGAWAEVQRLKDEAAATAAAADPGASTEVSSAVVDGINELKATLADLTTKVEAGEAPDIDLADQVSQIMRSTASEIIQTMIPEAPAAGDEVSADPTTDDLHDEVQGAAQDLADATALQRIMTDPNLAWEDKILLFLFLVVKRAQKNVEEQGKRIAHMQDGHGGDGDSIQLEMKKLERMMQALGELFETLSNVLKDCHERIFNIAKNMTLNG